MPASSRTGCSTPSAGSQRSAALFLVADLRRERAFWRRRFIAGWLTGAGFFQLYDGLVQHKLMGLHQIRYEVDLLPYDVAWNVIAAAMLVAGWG